MYSEETNFKSYSSFKSVLMKILLIVLLLFILMILFPTKGFISNYLNKNNTTESDHFNNNMIAMATAASGYYNKSRLPQNTGEQSKITLEEMINQKMITKFTDKKGIACSSKKSYVEVTREESEYTMKVNLSCAEKTDYMLLHMDLESSQFPSTSTARCQFVKNLDEAWTYGEWSSWGTERIEEDSTKQVESYTKQVQTGTKSATRTETQNAPASRYVFNGKNVYYVCGNEYDNHGTYTEQVTCVRTITIYTEVPTYANVTYYRWRSKILNEAKTETKEADCDNQTLINEGYKKIS